MNKIFWLSLLLAVAAPQAHASFHLMQIEQVIGGVDGDTTAQAVQLRMRVAGQKFLYSDAGGTEGPAALVAYDAAGANPVTLIVFPNDVANGEAGDRVLITSPNFVTHVAAAPTPDFRMTALIPASYLAAGHLDYVDGHGDVLWSLSFGGSNYQGPLAAATFNGSFGSPFAGPLPASDTSALLFQGPASAESVNNATDYQPTPAGAAFVNNAGAIFQLPGGSASVAVVSIQAITPKISEAGPAKGKFLVTRSGDTSADLAVNYQVGGSAIPGEQYDTLSGNLIIPAGKASAKIKVLPEDDGVKRGKSTVKVTLLAGDGYTVGSPAKAKIKIADAD